LRPVINNTTAINITYTDAATANAAAINISTTAAATSTIAATTIVTNGISTTVAATNAATNIISTALTTAAAITNTAATTIITFTESNISHFYPINSAANKIMQREAEVETEKISSYICVIFCFIT
jgi:hypothetical protein